MEKKCTECGSNAKENYFCCIACLKIIDYKCLGIKSKATFDLIIQLKNLRYICDDCNNFLVSQTNLLSKMHDCVDSMHKLQSELSVISSKFHDSNRISVDNTQKSNNSDDIINSCVTVPRPVNQSFQNNVCVGNDNNSNNKKNLTNNLCDNFNNNNNNRNRIAVTSVQTEQVPSVSSLPVLNIHKNKRKCNKKRADNTRIQCNNHEGTIQNKPVLSTIKTFQNNGNLRVAGDVIIGTSAGGTASIGAIPPRKWIFVSRLQPTVTDCEFKNFMKDNLRIMDASCTRFEKNAGYVSYKVGVPLECFEAVMKPEAWPEHLLIKEYNFNQKTNFRGVRQSPRMHL